MRIIDLKTILFCGFFMLAFSCEKERVVEEPIVETEEDQEEKIEEEETFSNDDVIKPWADNGWYWQFKGVPVLLLGASDDDNLFQWDNEFLVPHLDSMVQFGANYVRCTMSDRKDVGFEDYPFLMLENGKYDLTQWNEQYWKKFQTFLEETEKRDIIVQIEIWDRFDYSRDSWPPHPYNPVNNINYTMEEAGLDSVYPWHPSGNHQPFFFSTPKQRNNEILLPFQLNFVEKLLSISLKFNHVLYCIDNETRAEEEWAIFWAEIVLQKAKEINKSVYVTEMWDDWDLSAASHKYTFDHPERYAFCDVSQNNHNNGEVHWDNFQEIRKYVSVFPRPMNTVKTYGADGGTHGTTKDAIERWWKHVLGGVASARFHRPPAGLGMSDLSLNCIKVAREIEKIVNFWDLEPSNELLSRRQYNEAYLISKADETYVLFFTDGGEVSVDLTGVNKDFNLRWFEIRSGQLKLEGTLKGGQIIDLQAPGELEWIALISEQ